MSVAFDWEPPATRQRNCEGFILTYRHLPPSLGAPDDSRCQDKVEK